jgi:hypothetical protein
MTIDHFKNLIAAHRAKHGSLLQDKEIAALAERLAADAARPVADMDARQRAETFLQKAFTDFGTCEEDDKPMLDDLEQQFIAFAESERARMLAASDVEGLARELYCIAAKLAPKDIDVFWSGDDVFTGVDRDQWRRAAEFVALREASKVEAARIEARDAIADLVDEDWQPDASGIRALTAADLAPKPKEGSQP